MNNFSVAIKSPLIGYIHYAVTNASPSRYEFLGSLWFLLYSCPALLSVTDSFQVPKEFHSMQEFIKAYVAKQFSNCSVPSQITHLQNNSATVLCLLKSLTFIIIAISGKNILPVVCL